MKLLVAVLACSIVVMLLFGCSGSDPQSTPTIEATQSPTRVPPPPSPTPMPTQAPPALPLSPTRDDSLLGARVGAVDANTPTVYLYEPASRVLRKIGVAGPWAPNDLRLAGRKCCDPDTEGVALLDFSRREAIDFGPARGDVVGWSPDGGSLVFLQSDPYGATLGSFLVATDGTSSTALPVPVDTYQFAVRPNGRQIAFATQNGAFVADLQTGISTALATSVGGGARIGQWSPDGRYLFVEGDSGSSIIEVDTQKRTSLPANCCLLFWAPESDRAAIIRFDQFGRKRELFIIDEQDVAAGHLDFSVKVGNAFQVTWSPDGRYLAYLNDGCQTGDWSIHRVDLAAGTNVTLAPANHLVRLGLAWSPDGRYLSYAGYDQPVFGEATRGIYFFDLWEGAEEEIARAPNEASVRGGRWSPDGQFFAFDATGGFGVCDG